jgi:hypothetical protein
MTGSARDVITNYIHRQIIIDDGTWDNGWSTARKIADDVLAALSAAGLKVTGREPTEDVLTAAARGYRECTEVEVLAAKRSGICPSNAECEWMYCALVRAWDAAR